MSYYFSKQRLYFILSITFMHLPFNHTGIHPALLALCNEQNPASSIDASSHYLLFLRLCPSCKLVCETIPNSVLNNIQCFQYVFLTIFIAHCISHSLHKIMKNVSLFLLQIQCFLLVCIHIPTEQALPNLLWLDIVQNVEVCLTVCSPFTAICFVATRDLLRIKRNERNISFNYSVLKECFIIGKMHMPT